MNVGAIACGIFCLLFGGLALLFTCLGSKAAHLASGFDNLPKQEQDCYDTRRLSQDYRNQFLLWAAVFGVGGIVCWIFTPWLALPTFLLWLVLFFKGVHLDEKKAFAPYRYREP